MAASFWGNTPMNNPYANSSDVWHSTYTQNQDPISLGIDMGRIEPGMAYYQQAYMGDWIGDDSPNIKQTQPYVCPSCKTSHAKEKLDLIGRCTVKLKSHHSKLRKIKNAHNNKK